MKNKNNTLKRDFTVLKSERNLEVFQRKLEQSEAKERNLKIIKTPPSPINRFKKIIRKLSRKLK